MSLPVDYLIDTSALVRVLSEPSVRKSWEPRIIAGLIAVCPITELEFLYSARSADDRRKKVEALNELFPPSHLPDRVYDRAWFVQERLTGCGEHRSAGTVDLLVAASAELSGLTLLHCDHDFDCIARITEQPLQWAR